VKGSCLCGAISYTVDGQLDDIVVCHCGQCQKTSGSRVAATRIDESKVSISDPDSQLTWFRSSDIAQRGFCGRCGSPMFWKRDWHEKISIQAGSLDGPTGLKIKAHIHTDDAADYYTLPNDAPHFPNGGGL